MTNEKTIETRNTEWGFFGTIATQEHMDPAAEWNASIEYLMRVHHLAPETARDFLDAPSGRHIADAVIDSRAAGRTGDASYPAWLARQIRYFLKIYDPANYTL